MNTRHSNPGNRPAGFTLVELMVVIVIVAILAAVGYPSYLEYVTRSNRQAARAAIYAVADRQEQFFLDNKAYADGLDTLGYGDDTISIGRDGQRTGNDDGDRTYSVTISDSTDTRYTIEAAPEGIQAERDTDCATLSLTSSGERGDTGGGANCW
jgi:type IV pilus assembly protein PilE